MSAEKLQAELLAKFPFLAPRAGSKDHAAVNVPAENLVAFAKTLRDELSFHMLTDMTALDAGENESPRFTGIYHFFRFASNEYLRVACAAGNDAKPEIPSLVPVFPSANWFEREAYDMFGIKFTGHPDLRRIMMWDDYPYHPLRKEFQLAGKEAPLPGVDVFEGARTKIQPAEMAGGPFVSSPGCEPGAKDESWSDKKIKPRE